MKLPFEFRIEHFKEVSSTNSLLQQNAANGASEGLVIVADHQTEGRGKPGRTWESTPGKNLLCSILMRPPVSAHEAPMITQIACRAVAKTLKTYNIDSAFKRPNDVMIKDKKICGVLTESSTKGSKVECVIIGIGLNINAEGKELPVEGISMKMTAGKTFDREEVLNSILSNLTEGLTGLYDHSA